MNRQSIAGNYVEPFVQHRDKWSECVKCDLHKTACQKVFFRGQLPAHICFLGQAPGAGEDELGLPFVGEQGQILDEIIAGSIGEYNRKRLKVPGHSLTELRFAITNIVCCYPPNDRAPETGEIEACSFRLAEFLTMTKCRLLVLVGKKALVGYLRCLKYRNNKHIRSIEITNPGFMLRKGQQGAEGSGSSDRELEIARATALISEALPKVFK